jgi:hypothetical protein
MEIKSSPNPINKGKVFSSKEKEKKVLTLNERKKLKKNKKKIKNRKNIITEILENIITFIFPTTTK